jgi:hypothetical protein
MDLIYCVVERISTRRSSLPIGACGADPLRRGCSSCRRSPPTAGPWAACGGAGAGFALAAGRRGPACRPQQRTAASSRRQTPPCWRCEPRAGPRTSFSAGSPTEPWPLPPGALRLSSSNAGAAGRPRPPVEVGALLGASRRGRRGPAGARLALAAAAEFPGSSWPARSEAAERGHWRTEPQAARRSGPPGRVRGETARLRPPAECIWRPRASSGGSPTRR